jgi:hypothetical protein
MIEGKLIGHGGRPLGDGFRRALIRSKLGQSQAQRLLRGGALHAHPRGRARRRTRRSPSLEETVRNAADESLAEPALEFLARMPWAGPSPDPDVLDAATYLAWL